MTEFWDPTGVRTGDGRDPDLPPRTRPSPDQTRAGAGRHGLLEPGDPFLPAATPDHCDHPRARGSGRASECVVAAAQAAHPRFDPDSYKQRNIVERAINKLKGHRGVATRYDKRDYMFRGTVDVASIKICCVTPSHDPGAGSSRGTGCQRGRQQ
jgi:hypothetical protein